MSQEDQGFTVKDRRIFSDDGSTRQEEEPQPQAADKPQAEAQEEPRREAPRFEQLPPVDFSGLIISLSHAAMMHLGHIPDPASGQPRQELALARHTIDTIGMLKEKTKGNLTEDEHRLIEGALTELRLAFVQANR
ncbi:MAG: DUF1844 domain-containing protein [Desulfarculus sp.]|nr:DUF1844 domain-containing protein [Desulfarculus sp.]